MSELERERHKNTGLERARDSWYREWFKGNERITELETKVERLKTRVIAEEDDKNKRLDEMRAALAKQSLHVEDCHRQVEQAEAELETQLNWKEHILRLEAELAALKGRRCNTCRHYDDCGICFAAEGGAQFSCGYWDARP